MSNIPDLLDNKIRTARKDHICSYCNGIIHKSEKYDWSKLIYEGELYEWKAHLDCQKIASELWDYADPDEGMTEEDFYTACSEFCRTFICPDCEYADKETYDELECNRDESFCLDKIAEVFKHYLLRQVPRKHGDWWKVWKLIPKEENK